MQTKLRKRKNTYWQQGYSFNLKLSDLLDMSNWIYFIECESSRFVKIGRSVNIKERLSSLQAGNPSKLKLIAKVNCGQLVFAAKLESKLHEIFSDYRVRGEWFSFTKEEFCKLSFSFSHDGFARDVSFSHDNILEWLPLGT